MKFRFTDHALREMARRGIPKETVYEIMVRKAGRYIRPGDGESEPPRIYLYRFFVDMDRQPIEVVTVYRTSKVDKYWRTEE